MTPVSLRNITKSLLKKAKSPVIASYVNDVRMILNKSTGEVIYGEYPFTIDDVSFNDGKTITATEYTTWIWGETKVHYSKDMGKTWKTVKKLFTRVAPILGEDQKYYTLFFEGRNLDNTTLVVSNDLLTWQPASNDNVSCDLFNQLAQRKLKLTHCIL